VQRSPSEYRFLSLEWGGGLRIFGWTFRSTSSEYEF
jgi:hypothetical protein